MSKLTKQKDRSISQIKNQALENANRLAKDSSRIEKLQSDRTEAFNYNESTPLNQKSPITAQNLDLQETKMDESFAREVKKQPE